MTGPTVIDVPPTPEGAEHDVITEPGIYRMTNAQYHAQPGLSSTGAKGLTAPSCPALYKWEQDHPVYKDVYDFGHLVHTLILGDQGEVVETIHANDWKTKAAQDARKAARIAGRIPVLPHELARAKAMVAAARTHPIIDALLAPDTGTAELSLFWRDPITGVLLRARPDWLPHVTPGRRVSLADYKTAKKAERHAFAKAVVDYGYHQSAAWYIDGVIALGLDPDPAFVFIAQEKDAPYLPGVYELDVMALALGRRQNRAAIDIYAACVESDTWPGYSDEVDLLSLPVWYERLHEDV